MNRRQKHKSLTRAEQLHKKAKRLMTKYVNKNVIHPFIRKWLMNNFVISWIGEWAVMMDKMMNESRFGSLSLIDPSKYEVTENGNVLRSSSERPNK